MNITKLEEMNEESKAMIDKLKEDRYFKELYKNNTIEMNDYFAYSGKEEYNNTFISLIPFYRNKKNVSIKNNMSKYVLKDYNNNNNKTK